MSRRSEGSVRIFELCTREVVCCERHAAVLEVAQRMRHHRVGDLIFGEMREDRLTPVGAVTDGDLVLGVLAEGVAPEALTAGDRMTRRVVAAPESASVHEAIERMRAEGIRRLPVVGVDGVLVGVLAADDFTEFLAEELTGVARIAPRQAAPEKAALPPAKQ
jgi:CBS domain-containing protein